ncbi:NAD-dependent epimerase/dehydratase family protein [Blastococcus sp. BMG 814]|uniref:NAD-dependent epimerase/dehydratase family protein n=1 Tax=Blastococcus carthaginiensis TaxID=3050034 RepID=A0ABT9IE45_9ACTN|nr:NAD-dependent epimerase/dehydratase family protein [Blastococcus carthaginiensis]MDP5183841.1 NAD-dependent epimerase/dehydratase family protein [Blastococcus carthaginiensis]
MRVAVTGANGFLGWHLQCALLAGGKHVAVPVSRPELADAASLRQRLQDCDAVVHLAGVNRGSDEDVEAGNRYLAVTLAEALEDTPIRIVVHGNSIHAGTATPFGRSKAFATDTLAQGAAKVGAVFADLMLPNVFGEGGRPFYNSVVATFAHELAAGRQPTVKDDRELPLLHAQDAADQLLDVLLTGQEGVIRPTGIPTLVSDVLTQLEGMTSYRDAGDFPNLSTRFRVALFNTYQSFCFPGAFPIDKVMHSDARGTLFESARAQSTDSLSFVSTTVPGAVRGQHFHRRKVERFIVVDGEAEIRLRRLITGEEIAFAVSGSRPQAVDMPPMWAHSLKNTGSRPVTTVFWTNELLDPQSPDTYPFPVYPSAQD